MDFVIGCSNTIVSGKMEDLKIEQRGIIKFLTLDGVASEQIWERLQKVYREETVSSSQVEHWATETTDDRCRNTVTILSNLEIAARHSEMVPQTFLPSSDVMANVLAFLSAQSDRAHRIASRCAGQWTPKNMWSSWSTELRSISGSV